MTGKQQPKRNGDRNLGESEATAFASFMVVIAVLLAVAGTFLATIYLSGLLMQKMQQLQRYHEPRAQYPYLGKWQGRR